MLTYSPDFTYFEERYKRQGVDVKRDIIVRFNW